MTNTISVLGSTGSIGRQTLDVVRALNIGVAALTANRSVEIMERQCREFQPQLAVMADEAAARDLRVRLRDTHIRVACGMDAICEAATMEQADTVGGSMMGIAGLRPTLEALKKGKRLALANKETLVCAGELVMQTAKQYGAEIIPVDSEHSAIFQCLMGCRDRGEVKRLILTASGGPFFGKSRAELEHVKAVAALKHPNWTMGQKITIDSATMMNKGLECIEAMRLYDLPQEKVSIVIHRQSIVHSLVEYCDGAVLAQLGAPDMRIPIQLAMTYPNRTCGPADTLDLLECGALTFQAPDYENFPCLGIALDAARRGGTACAAMSGANEVAVEAYLAGKIGFYDISRLVLAAMDTDTTIVHPDLSQILAADARAREYVAARL
ncbi:MAG: 1-deoxy-D-xylulose-5-phosphate reductoisomerase [Oscillospiraceae bacterium]|nr:1-deoxy-D-xylulose-5-phosphate reductoisomerase [Oscillospiraceae bacterium]